MRLAVLPVWCSDSSRTTELTREWIHRMVGHCAGYYLDQSGGRENIEWRVFDWYKLPLTSQQWNENGFGISDVIKPIVSEGLNVDLSGYDHFAIVIDKFDAKLGVRVPDKPDLLLGAQDLDPAILQHELGHLFGASHANLAGPTGPIEYGDSFCVMGAEGAKYSFVQHPLDITTATAVVTTVHSDSGPAMVVPTLSACGWFDFDDHGNDIGAALRAAPWETTVDIGALHGAPAPTQPRLVTAWADGVADQRLVIEYRVRDGWDRAIPAPPAGGPGWVVVHVTQGSETSPQQIGVLAAVAGQSIYLDRAVLRLTVIAVDIVRQSVILRAGRETWRPWFIPRPERQFSRLAPVDVTTRQPEQLDIFKVGRDGAVWSTWWHGEGDPGGWRPWFPIHPETVFAQDAPVAALCRTSEHLDLFVTGLDGAVWTAWWQPEGGWRSWSQIHPETVFAQNRQTVAVSRRAEQIDLFRVGFDGAAWTAWWHGDGDTHGWRPWSQIHPETRFLPSAEMSAASREPDQLDLFVVGLDGRVWSTWWHEGDPIDWHPWFTIPGDIRFDPSQRVAVVARAKDQLDLFCMAPTGVVYWAQWRADEVGWRPWASLFPDSHFHPKNKVSVIARESDHLDLFVVATDGTVWSAWWHEEGEADGWRPWLPIQPNTVFDARLPVTALSRNSRQVDLFASGYDDNVWATWWHPV